MPTFRLSSGTSCLAQLGHQPFDSDQAPAVWLSSGTSLLTQIRHQPFGSAPALAFWLSSGTSYLTRLRHQLFRSAPAVSLSTAVSLSSGTSCFTDKQLLLDIQILWYQIPRTKYLIILVWLAGNIFTSPILIGLELLARLSRLLTNENGTMQPRNHESMKMVPCNQGTMKA